MAWNGGMTAASRSDTRWCSDGFEIGCDNGERVRIAFTLDCCDREAISWVATTGGIDSGDICDLMIDSVERRFGLVKQLPIPIEWLSDNGSPYTARETRRIARDIGLRPCTTPIESPQSTDVIDKRFFRGSLLTCSRARMTARRRAGHEVQALPRSLYRRSSFAAPVRAFGPRGFQPATKRA
jgi:putative transposase